MLLEIAYHLVHYALESGDSIGNQSNFGYLIRVTTNHSPFVEAAAVI